jgi:Flp pilus assembly protein TadD
MSTGSQNPVEILVGRARQAYAGGDFHRTIAICDGLLERLDRRRGIGPELLNLKAISLMNIGRMEEAGAVLRQALKARPAMAGAQANMARVLAALGQRRPARRHAAEACRLAPREPAVLYTAAQALRDSGDHERAMRATRKILEISPSHADAWHLKGSLELDGGYLEQAAESLEKTVSIRPQDTQALATLLKLRRSTPADRDLVCRLETIRSGSLPPADRASAIFALADMHRRDRNHRQAFELYREANALAAPGRPFDMAQFERGVDAVIDMTTGAEAKAAESDPSGERLVFIVGMPRSGTSLLEQVISAHSSVMGAGELTAMEQVEQDLEKSGAAPFMMSGPSSPGEKQLALGRERYLSCLPQAQGRFRRIIDKAPMNFQRVAMIHNLFPAARYLYCVRHPLDTIVSCFFHDFRHGLGFAFRLDYLAAVYVAQIRLMRHWLNLFGPRIQVVSYPNLVGDLESSARDLAGFLGIGFEAAMLEPQLNRRVVKTASSIQVREAVHGNALGVWKNYREELRPVIDYLLDAGILVSSPDGQSGEELDGPVLSPGANAAES